jgi:hypothetical protein
MIKQTHMIVYKLSILRKGQIYKKIIKVIENIKN